MFLKKSIWAGLLWGGMLLCSPQLALSEDVSSPLTLEVAIEKALDNNLELKAVRARLLVKQAQIKTANTLPNPFFLSDSGIAERTYRIGLTQIVELGGKRKRRTDLAKAQQAVTAAEIETFMLELRARVRRAYTRLFLAQQKVRLYTSLMSALERINNRNPGSATVAVLDIDAFEMEKSLSDLQNDFQQFQSEEGQAQNELNTLVNTPLSNTVSLSPPVTATVATLPSVETLLQQAYFSRPELQENLHNLQAIQRESALRRAQRIPNLILSVGPDLVSNSPGTLDVNAFIIGMFELPLLDRQQGPLAEAKAQRLQVEAEAVSLRQQIALEVKNAYLAWTAREAQGHRYEADLLPKASTLVTQAEAQFKAGKLGPKALVRAYQLLFNTQLGSLDALQARQDAFADLERAVGRSL